MLLITVGTEQYQFNALMHWIELLTKYQLINEEVLVRQFKDEMQRLEIFA